MEKRTHTVESGDAAPLSREIPPAAIPVASVELSWSRPRPQETRQHDEARERAGFWVRLVAFGIDCVILAAFAVLLFLVGWFGFRLGDPLAPAASSSLLFLFALVSVATPTAAAAYFTILHSEHGQTIGKYLLGLEVCTLDGEPLSYSQALVRYLAYGFSFFFFGFGFLWVALNPGKRGWHDLLAGTMVVISNYREQ